MSNRRNRSTSSKETEVAKAGAETPDNQVAPTAQPEPGEGQAGGQSANDAGGENEQTTPAPQPNPPAKASGKRSGPIAKQLVRYKGKTYGPGESAGTDLPADIDEDTVASFRALGAIE